MSTATLEGAAKSSRLRVHRVIRQAHLWIGAWGAIAAVLFGVSGFLQNHRGVLKLPQGSSTEASRIEIPSAKRDECPRRRSKPGWPAHSICNSRSSAARKPARAVALLSDSFAVGLVALGLSGLVMWSRNRTARQLILSIVGGSAVVLVLIGASAIL